MSEKIQRHHLERKAILYVRQSTPHQVQHNRESGALQYAMRGRLEGLGFTRVETIDDDLGRSASGGAARAGFDRMVAEVCLGKVGAVAAREVSRFARNSRDWQQLIEMCRVVDTVLVDHDAVYAPRQGNDRLLLGLKGQLNEYEVDLLRQRSLAARDEKARRGELFTTVPVGFVKNGGRLEKEPDRRVQQAIALVFDKVEELGSVRQTLLWFHGHGLELPVRRPGRETVWRPPSYATIYRMVTNPVYAGAYAFGQRRTVTTYEGSGVRKRTERKPRDEWLVLKPGSHEGYVEWERAEAIRAMVSGNAHAGRVRPGAKRALLAGLLRCRRCGRKLSTGYSGNNHDVVRYACGRGTTHHGERRCIAFGGVRVDKAVGDALLEVVGPGAVDAAVRAEAEAANGRDDVGDALRRDREAARYAADRAFRQYDAGDPANRLVTAELEARWEAALGRLAEAEAKLAAHETSCADRPQPAPGSFATLAEDLRSVWYGPDTDTGLKKRIVRTLVHEIIADIDAEAADGAGEIVLVVHWKGGAHTELRLTRRRSGRTNVTSVEVVEAMRQLARIASDDLIAGVLNRHGLRTGNGKHWTRERVNAARSYRDIPRFRPAPDGIEPWLNLKDAAALLDVSPRTLRLAVKAGQIHALRPLPDGPWLFERADLDGPPGQTLAKRVRRHRSDPAEPDPKQQSLLPSTT